MVEQIVFHPIAGVFRATIDGNTYETDMGPEAMRGLALWLLLASTGNYDLDMIVPESIVDALGVRVLPNGMEIIAEGRKYVKEMDRAIMNGMTIRLLQLADEKEFEIRRKM